MLYHDKDKDIFFMCCNSCHKHTEIVLENLVVSHKTADEIVLCYPCTCGALDFYALHEDHALLICKFLLKEQNI